MMEEIGLEMRNPVNVVIKYIVIFILLLYSAATDVLYIIIINIQYNIYRLMLVISHFEMKTHVSKLISFSREQTRNACVWLF